MKKIDELDVYGLTDEDFKLLEKIKPKKRSDCENGIRPCPFVSCKHNLLIGVDKKTGEVELKIEIDDFPILADEYMEDSSYPIGTKRIESCTLDVADWGGASFEEIEEAMDMTAVRIEENLGKMLIIFRRQWKAHIKNEK